MPLAFIDGFDHYSIDQILRKWSAQKSSNATASLDTGRIWGSSYKNAFGYTATESAKGLTHTLPVAKQGGVLGFAYKGATYWAATSGNHFVAIGYPGFQQIRLHLNRDGTISVIRRDAGSDAATLAGPASHAGMALGSWFFVEFRWLIANGTGAIGVRINGDVIIEATNIDTQNSSCPALYTNWALLASHGLQSAETAECWLDDVYFYDDYNDGFKGDCNVRARMPNGAGSTTMGTPSAGANYQCVDEASADDDTTRVTLAAVNDYDTYQMEDVDPGITVLGVQLSTLAKKSEQGTCGLDGVVRSGGTDYPKGAGVGIGTDYRYHRHVWEVDPATGVAFTAEGLNAAEFGSKKVA